MKRRERREDEGEKEIVKICEGKQERGKREMLERKEKGEESPRSFTLRASIFYVDSDLTRPGQAKAKAKKKAKTKEGMERKRKEKKQKQERREKAGRERVEKTS